MKVSIVIPVYNEAKKLTEVLDRVIAASLPSGCVKEIIVVDDGSTDGTARILRQYPRADMLVIHHSVLNFGKGIAVRVGFAKATGDVVLIQDGDLEYDPSDYIKVVEPIVSGEAAVVYGSRFRGRMQGMQWKNWLANKILTLSTNVLYNAGITDEATAYKAFRMDLIRSMRLECRRFEFCPEVTAKVRRLGHRITEVPISYNARGIADGKKIRWQDGVHAFWTLLRWRLARRSTLIRSDIAVDPNGFALAPEAVNCSEDSSSLIAEVGNAVHR